MPSTPCFQLDTDRAIASETVIKKMSSHPLDDCNTNDATLAFVWIPDARWEVDAAGKGELLNFPSQVTICPWYLKYESGVKFKVSRRKYH